MRRSAARDGAVPSAPYTEAGQQDCENRRRQRVAYFPVQVCAWPDARTLWVPFTIFFAGRSPFALHLMSPTHPPEQVDAMFQRLRFAGLDNVLVLQRRAA